MAAACFCGAAQAQDRMEAWLAAPSMATAAEKAKPEKSPCPPSRATPSADGKYAICVAFDYDFHLTPACSEKRPQYCVKQFIVYDISAKDHPYALGTIPLPEKTHGKVLIWHVTERRAFESGRHRIAVSAQGPEPPLPSPEHPANGKLSATSPAQAQTSGKSAPGNSTSSANPQNTPIAPQSSESGFKFMHLKPPESPPLACWTWVNIP